MSLIVCPECRKMVSEFAEVCPHCGNPKIQERVREINSQILYYCPVCGDVIEEGLLDDEIWADGCPHCYKYKTEKLKKKHVEHQQYVSTGKTVKEMDDAAADGGYFFKDEPDYYEYVRDTFARKHPLWDEEAATWVRLPYEQKYPEFAAANMGPLIRCPMCKSTIIKSISGLERMASVFTLGLASNKIGKQYKCYKCGYMW